MNTAVIVIGAAIAFAVVAFLVAHNRTQKVSPEAVAQLLRSLRDRTISGIEWDNFISVNLADPELERIRETLEALWVEGSPYLVEGSLDPRDLNPKGAMEIDRLIKLADEIASRSAAVR